MYKYIRIAKSQIPNSGDGAYAKCDLAADFDLGVYKGRRVDLNKLSDAEMIYAADGGDGTAIVGTGLGAKINDNIDLRKLTPAEYKAVFEEGKPLPRLKQFPHNVSLTREDEKGKPVHVHTIKAIKKDEELFVDYGDEYWKSYFEKY